MIKRLLFLAALTAVPLLDAVPQTAQPEAPTTDGAVNVALVDETRNTVYIGGPFSGVGPYGGGLAPFDASTGEFKYNYPHANGAVLAINTDGAGGWFVGGSFTRIGGIARTNIAHIRSNGTVDPSWNPGVNGPVYTLIVYGSAVYIGGGFTNAGGSTRVNLAAISRATGSATGWNPGANDTVRTLGAARGRVYAGGHFTFAGGQSRAYAAAFDTVGGTPTGWNPNADSYVMSLSIYPPVVYAGGWFSSFGGQTRWYLAAVDTGAGNATSWNPAPSSYVTRTQINLSTLYVSGPFNTIAGANRYSLAAFDAVSGSLVSWAPTLDGVAYAITVANSIVYVGGFFSTVNGTPKSYLAALDATSGALLPWESRTDGIVYSLFSNGSVTYAGGAFQMVNRVERANLAAFDATTGAIKPWDPAAGNLTGTVTTMDRSGNRIYVGGTFLTVGFSGRAYVAAIDADNGTVSSSWTPVPDGPVFAVRCSADSVFLGGSFHYVNSVPRENLAKVDGSTGALLLWNPGANFAVRTLDLGMTSQGPALYVGGQFSSIAGVTQSYLAAVRIEGVKSWLWGWNPATDGPVNQILVKDTLVYLAGAFGHTGPDARAGLAAVGIEAGRANSMIPPIVDYTPFAVGVLGPTVYYGGNFSLLGGSRRYLFGIDSQTGLLTSWDPKANGYVYALTVSPTYHRIYAGGLFTQAGGEGRKGFVALDDPYNGALDIEPALRTPATFTLGQNFPNPFNPTTTIQYRLPRDEVVSLKVYDLLGREVATLVDERQNPGDHVVRFDASTLSTGTYFYRLRAGNRTEVRKMLLAK